MTLAAIERRPLAQPHLIEAFILAGNATVTFVSKKSGKRYTMKFTRSDDNRFPDGHPKPKDRVPVWAKLLVGSDNESNYEFVGTVWETQLGARYNPRRGGPEWNADYNKFLRWFFLNLDHAVHGQMNYLDQCEVWHEGKCGRCGRKLTVPESIESGFGPECITKIGR